MTVLKIKDRDHLVKDIETGAVINTDTQAYEKRIKLRFETQRQRDQLRDAVREINTIKSEITRYFKSNLDVILSDMAADTTGSKSLDAIRTNQLSAEVIHFSKDILKPKGVLVSKLFMGEDFIEVKNLAKSIFKNVNFFKPESSRKESKETYLHCETLKTL